MANPSGAIAVMHNTITLKISNQPICCRQTRMGIMAVKVKIISKPTKAIRQGIFPNNGAKRKLSNQINFTRASKECSQVIGCSK